MCQIYYIDRVDCTALKIFVSSTKFSASVMTLDSRDTQKQDGAAKSTPKILEPAPNIFATFYVTSRLHEQIFVFRNFLYNIARASPI